VKYRKKLLNNESYRVKLKEIIHEICERYWFEIMRFYHIMEKQYFSGTLFER